MKKVITAASLIIVVAGCTKKLDLVPTNDITADAVYKNPAGYKQALAKVLTQTENLETIVNVILESASVETGAV